MTDREIIEKIKSAIDIVDLINEHVVLKKSGAKFKGLSPFTQEKTPSFFVDPVTQLFYCFSSNRGGDIFDYVMFWKGMSFPEALEWLANRAEIKLPKHSFDKRSVEQKQKEDKEKQLLLKLNRFAAHFFQSQLTQDVGVKAKAYLDGRALQQNTIQEFGIGYAPDSWSALRDYFIKIKAPLLAATQLGLLRVRNEEKPKSDGSNLYDAYRDRIIFPIRNLEGEVIGFGGRALAENSENVKYINSPESPVYEKNKALYNMDSARRYIRELDTAILVEGYMDCIAMYQAGFKNTVATLGTALSQAHVQLLRKTADKVISLFDADVAGQKATERNMDMFLQEGLLLLGARIPSGKDPDEFLRSHKTKGHAELQKILHSAPALLDQWIENLINNTSPTTQGRASSLEQIAAKLALLENEIWIKTRIPEIASRLYMGQKLVWDAIVQKQSGAKNVSKTNAKSENIHKIFQKTAKADSFERRILLDMLRYSDWLPAIRRLQPDTHKAILGFFGDAEVAHAMALLLKPLDEQETEAQRLNQLLDWAKTTNNNLHQLCLEKIMERAESQVAGLWQDALERLRKNHIDRMKKFLSLEIRRAEAKGDVRACEQLQQQLLLLIQNKTFREERAFG